MIIYILTCYYDYEGYDEPEFAFLKHEDASKKREELIKIKASFGTWEIKELKVQ